MAYDFDRIIDRRRSDSLKWTARAGKDVLPLWVADMDFQPAPEVLQAIRERVQHGIFGYAKEPESLFAALIDWLEERHGWVTSREWMLHAPGVVPSIVFAIHAFSSPGDKVVIQPPVYHPFRSCILENGRQLVENPLRIAGNGYEMDLDMLDRQIDARTRMVVLCSPHNPVGRLWSREELYRLAEVCAVHDVVLVSDEIHMDFAMGDRKHVPIARVGGRAAEISVTLVSATKTFNIAGLGESFAIIPNPELRRKFSAAQRCLFPGLPNALSLVAQEAAFRFGGPWLDELLAYLRGNYDLLVTRVRERLPAVGVFPLEGTYLAWLDMRRLGLPDQEITRRLLDVGGVWLDEGAKFGTGGQGFQRLNLACPRSILNEAIDRIVKALA